MSNSDLFYKYLVACFGQLEKSLVDYRRNCNNKLLFRFRVSIKKIRTCLDCIEYYQGEKKFKKTRKGLKVIFRSGGILRELRIYDAWFRRHHLLRLATNIKLKQQIAGKEQEFTGKADKITNIIKNTKQAILPAGKKLQQQDVYQYYVLMLRDQLPQLMNRPAKHHWHKARKYFKKILYARHWQKGVGLAVLSKRQAVFLDQLQHLIGYWHDNEMMIEWLKTQQPPGATARTLYKKALELLAGKSEQYFRRVNNKFSRCASVFQPLSNRLMKIGSTHKSEITL